MAQLWTISILMQCNLWAYRSKRNGETTDWGKPKSCVPEMGVHRYRLAYYLDVRLLYRATWWLEGETRRAADGGPTRARQSWLCQRAPMPACSLFQCAMHVVLRSFVSVCR